MLQLLIEKIFWFVFSMTLLSLFMLFMDFHSNPSSTFIYPEMDTMYNCFPDGFFETLKLVHNLMKPMSFLKSTPVFDMVNLCVMRSCFIIYDHLQIFAQMLFLGLTFGYAAVTLFRNSMFSLKSSINIIYFLVRLFKYLSIFLMFQWFCDFVYLTSVVLLFTLFLYGIKIAVIFFVG